jgi:hypothetical protein
MSIFPLAALIVEGISGLSCQIPERDLFEVHWACLRNSTVARPWLRVTVGRQRHLLHRCNLSKFVDPTGEPEHSWIVSKFRGCCACPRVAAGTLPCRTRPKDSAPGRWTNGGLLICADRYTDFLARSRCGVWFQSLTGETS